MTLEGYLSRLHNEDLSPELSLMAVADGKPIGFLLNGIRVIAGRKTAWNGGTGVIPSFRSQGVGKAMVQASLDLYRAQNVELASLEAISENEKAIKLYQQCGYEIIDRLVSLQHPGSLNSKTFLSIVKGMREYSIQPVAPDVVSRLEFYQDLVPWQTQWQSVAKNNGEALIVFDQNATPVGYALYKKRLDEQGRLGGIALYQCKAKPDHDDEEEIIATALRYLYTPLEWECRRSTNNLSQANQTLLRLLEASGFTLFVEQVHMLKRM